MHLGLKVRNAKKKQIENLRDERIRIFCGTGYRKNIVAYELVKGGFNAATSDEGVPSWNES